MWNALRTAIVLIGGVLTFPLVLLAWVAPVVSIIWLLILREWGLLLLGVVLGFVAPLIISGILGGGLTILLAAKPPAWLATLATFLLGLVAFAIIVFYSLWVFAMGLHHAHGNVWPYLLWAYATAITPWQAIAGKAPKGDAGAVVWCSTAQFGGAAMLIALGCGMYYGSGAVFILGALLGTVTGYIIATDRRGGEATFSPSTPFQTGTMT